MSPTRPNRRFSVGGNKFSAAPPPPAAAVVIPAAAGGNHHSKSNEKKRATKPKKTPLVRREKHAELWIEKYAPTSEAELAIFKKRITEFKVIIIVVVVVLLLTYLSFFIGWKRSHRHRCGLLAHACWTCT